MELVHFILQNPYFDVIVVTGATYIVRIFFSPSKAEVKLFSKFLIMLIVACVNLLKRWYLKHPEAMTMRLDSVYKHVFHTKHYLPNEESGKIIVG